MFLLVYFKMRYTGQLIYFQSGNEVGKGGGGGGGQGQSFSLTLSNFENNRGYNTDPSGVFWYIWVP